MAIGSSRQRPERRRIYHDGPAPYAEGNRSLAGRKHWIDARPDCRFLQTPPLEVKAIADDEGVQSIIGRDPIVTGQLARDELAKGEADPNYRLRLAEPELLFRSLSAF
jgi:Protein of unknown function (DUF1013)